MNIFSYSDYRELLRAAVKERKPFEPGFGFHSLADAGGSSAEGKFLEHLEPGQFC